MRCRNPITIDGILAEPAWRDALPILLEHSTSRDSSTCEVRLLWDEAALYLAFDVKDRHVETANHDWDDDNVSIAFLRAGRPVKYRFDIGGTGEGLGHIAAGRLKASTTRDNPNDLDQGFTIEFRIPWSEIGVTPHAGLLLPVELMSLDHDMGPGLAHNAPGVKFSKVSLDRDRNIDTVRRTIRLVEESARDFEGRAFDLEEGRLSDWLLLGPFPSFAIDDDPLAAGGGESSAKPEAGTTGPAGRAWKTAFAPELDLESTDGFGTFDDALVYAATWIWTPDEREAQLLLGSDDGVKVWVNGRECWRNDAARPVKPDEDRVHIRLKSGWNLLLFKVIDLGGGSGLVARLTDRAGGPMQGLKTALRPLPQEGSAR